MNNWQRVFEDERQYRAEMVLAVLEDNHMNPVMINKKVSAYGLGSFEVHVAPDFVIRALKIIKEDIRFE